MGPEKVRLCHKRSRIIKNLVTFNESQTFVSHMNGLIRSLVDIQGKVVPLLQRSRLGMSVTSAGITYLEAKHFVYLIYSMYTVFYLSIKVEGLSVKNHLVMLR